MVGELRVVIKAAVVQNNPSTTVRACTGSSLPPHSGRCGIASIRNFGFVTLFLGLDLA